MKYKSRFGESEITASQYIAELLVARKALNEKVILPDHFWKNFDYQAWKAEFLKQKRKADAFLRAGFSPESIIETLKEKRFERIYSLYFKQLEFAIQEKDRQIQLKKSIAPQDPLPDIEVPNTSNVPPTKKVSGVSKINKLRD
jgi:hypothetical protein